MIVLGRWTVDELDALLRAASSMPDMSSRLIFLSGHFIGTPYKAATLVGDLSIPEELVINLREMDCFTFIDYIEAMRLSASFSLFQRKLGRVRYRCGEIAYAARNHFFTDWRERNADFVTDVTARIGGDKAVSVRKKLNEKEDGTPFLPGIAAETRVITSIPSGAVGREILEALTTGDYIGICSDRPGLDVSHVGIFIRAGNKMYLRHASSASSQRKVVDQEFRRYIKTKPGIVVLRPK